MAADHPNHHVAGRSGWHRELARAGGFSGALRVSLQLARFCVPRADCSGITGLANHCFEMPVAVVLTTHAPLVSRVFLAYSTRPSEGNPMSYRQSLSKSRRSPEHEERSTNRKPHNQKDHVRTML